MATEHDGLDDEPPSVPRTESAYGRAGRSAWCTAENFMREEWRSAVGYAMRIGAPREEAEDLVQETFILVSKHWPTIKNPKAWTMLVIRRKYIDFLRGQREISTELLPDQASYLFQGSLADTPHDSYAATELRRELGVALTALPPDEQLCVLMAMSGSTGREIAVAIGRSPVATRALLSKTRKRIAQMLMLDRRRRRRGEGPDSKEESP